MKREVPPSRLKQMAQEQPAMPQEQPQSTIMSPQPILSIIGPEEIAKAQATLEKYKDGKANLDKRIIENEQWFKLRHWEQIRGAQQNESEPEPASAWLLNAIINKHADAMDNYPEPVILPREESDKQDAEILSEILPVIHDRNEFEQTYSDVWWQKLKGGTGVYGVFWNNRLEGGLGDIDIKKINILNIFWEPGISDIQDSRNVFVVNLVDMDLLTREYPQLNGRLGSGPSITLNKFEYDDTVDTSNKAAVVDWYYKQTINDGVSIREVLHYCKFCNGEVLFASENPPTGNMPDFRLTGWYEHGMYPFVFDTMFVEEGTPCGFGYIDIAKDPQKYIDKLNQIVIDHAYDARNTRFLASDSLGMSEEELKDRSKRIVHVTNQISDNTFRELTVSPLSPFIVDHLNSKVDELKETTGNRDFSQGGTTSGVTAASAIAALQEAGSKTSRDMIKSSYRAHAKINRICIELIRQFYTEQRTFRIVSPNGGEQFVGYQNSNIVATQANVPGVGMVMRKPIFDINIRAQKSSPFSKVAQNELAKELYSGGFFNPQMADQAKIAIEMMDFEGKDMVLQKISQNGTLMQLLQQMIPMAQLIDQQNGSNLTAVLAQQLGMPMPTQAQSSGGTVQTNPLGSAVRTSEANTATKAQEKATNVAQPK